MTNSPSDQISRQRRSRLIVIITLIVAVVFGLIFALSEIYRPRPKEMTPVKAVTAFPPLIYLVAPLFGDNPENTPVESLISAGADLHDYSPLPSDIEKAVKADVFFTLGVKPLPLESLFLTENQPQLISAAEGIDRIHMEEEEHEETHGHDQVDYDIHFWMSPRQAVTIVDNFEKGLSALYPEDSLYYRARGEKFKARLRELDKSYQQTLAGCQKKWIVVSHNAFAYLAQDYGLKVYPIYRSEEEAADLTSARLIKASEKIKELDINYIFYTGEANLRILKTLSRELGVSLLPIYTLEGIPPRNFSESSTTIPGYIEFMEENLRLLSQGLSCPSQP